MQYQILRLAKGGLGISQTNGKTWFVEGALPGESGSAEVIEEKQKYGKARAISRQDNAPCRQLEDACPCAQQCDGCGFRHVKPEYALELKAQAVYADIIRNAHMGDVPYTCIGLKQQQLDRTRHRVRLHIQGNQIGYFARGSHHVIPASQCAVIAQELCTAIEWLQNHLHKAQLDHHARLDVQIDLDVKKRAYAHFKTIQERVLKRHQHRPGKKQPPKQAPLNLKLLEQLASEAIQAGAFAGIRVENKTFGLAMIEDCINGDICVYRQIGDFAQATPEANAAIHQLVVEFVQQTNANSVADLYSGSGNLTFRAACHAERVIACEYYCSKVAFQRGLEANAALFKHGHHIELIEADLSKGLPPKAADVDVIICDPARDGLSEAIIHDICRSRASHILYVSCEASCLARDIARLAPDFAVQKLTFVDMFPQTPHVETVAWLKRI
ncbi:MAG: 23S rRNA (uracil(1939)-C(5))-methyltransferase RlmD [Proteobacteria bacterium]|nr:23S rRNA (uracil(1939)-C(5))-methyltransferase RlmD [Pseudomonadota bacterium]